MQGRRRLLFFLVIWVDKKLALSTESTVGAKKNRHILVLYEEIVIFVLFRFEAC